MSPKELLDTILGYLGFVVEIDEQTNESGNLTLQIYTEESRRMIGRDGETLDAIQFLLNRLIQSKDKDAPKVIVDCEHYRSMREDRVVHRVRELAERVRITGRSLQLEPMNSYERRIVHNAFKDDPEVATWSPSDSARIKQITLFKRQAKKEAAPQQQRADRLMAPGRHADANCRSIMPIPNRFENALADRAFSLGLEKIFERRIAGSDLFARGKSDTSGRDCHAL